MMMMTPPRITACLSKILDGGGHDAARAAAAAGRPRTARAAAAAAGVLKGVGGPVRDLGAGAWWSVRDLRSGPGSGSVLDRGSSGLVLDRGSSGLVLDRASSGSVLDRGSSGSVLDRGSSGSVLDLGPDLAPGRYTAGVSGICCWRNLVCFADPRGKISFPGRRLLR